MIDCRSRRNHRVVRFSQLGLEGLGLHVPHTGWNAASLVSIRLVELRSRLQKVRRVCAGLNARLSGRYTLSPGSRSCRKGPCPEGLARGSDPCQACPNCMSQALPTASSGRAFCRRTAKRRFRRKSLTAEALPAHGITPPPSHISILVGRIGPVSGPGPRHWEMIETWFLHDAIVKVVETDGGQKIRVLRGGVVVRFGQVAHACRTKAALGRIDRRIAGVKERAGLITRSSTCVRSRIGGGEIMKGEKGGVRKGGNWQSVPSARRILRPRALGGLLISNR